jgi:hypothetical protein
LGTTYYGVCINEGIELNYNAILLAQKFGFLKAAGGYLILKTVISSFLAVIVYKSRKDQIYLTFMLIVAVLFLTDFANTIVLNINTLMYQEVGKTFAPPDEHMKDMSQQQVERVIQTFEREDFCRLI